MKKTRIIFASLVACLMMFSSQSLSAQNAPANAPATKAEPVYKDFKTEMVLEAKVNIGSMVNVGDSKRGSRRIIPITGGTFSGPNIKGTVLPMGEDWQLTRPDGATELNATYLLKTDDGVVIRINNQVLMGSGPARSVIDLEAPLNSPYAYLNKSIFLGTLGMGQPKPGENAYVVITVYKVL